MVGCAAAVALKRSRRMAVGPFATFYFEHYVTMWHQIHEMLHVERGGEAQIADELAPYNPLIPNGEELVATVVFEIDDAVRRASVLGRLGGVEATAFTEVGPQRIAGFARSRSQTHPRRRQGEFGAVHLFRLRAGPNSRLPYRWRPDRVRFRASELRPHGRDDRGCPLRPRQRFRLIFWDERGNGPLPSGNTQGSCSAG